MPGKSTPAVSTDGAEVLSADIGATMLAPAAGPVVALNDVATDARIYELLVGSAADDDVLGR